MKPFIRNQMLQLKIILEIVAPKFDPIGGFWEYYQYVLTYLISAC